MLGFRQCAIKLIIDGGACRWKIGHRSLKPSASWNCQPLLLRASDSMFKHLFQECPTETAYATSPLGTVSQLEQGKLLQAWARQTLQRIYPKSKILDPEPGTCCNGSNRSAWTATHDFVLEGRKVEVKSARVTWSSTRKVWMVSFWNVKLPYGKRSEPFFDDLYLVLACPRALLLIRHDLHAGIQSDGRRTEATGYKIQILGRTSDSCLEEALDTILRKICEENSCTLVAEQLLDDAQIEALLATHRECTDVGHSMYFDVPWCHLSSAKRGLRIQDMALTIDKKMHPQSHFLHAGVLVADWARDAVWVEMKCCKLVYSKTQNRWLCHFAAIKPQCFDELWLAIYSPWDVRFYKCSFTTGLGLSTNGVRTKHFGFELRLAGKHCDKNPQDALRVIETMLMSRGCTPMAIVKWETWLGFQQ